MKSVVVAVSITVAASALEAAPITDVSTDADPLVAEFQGELVDASLLAALAVDPPPADTEAASAVAESEAVLEPSTLALLGLGVVGLLVARQRSSSKSKR